ncbi:MAG: hypothetical protein KAI83_03555 [Thiomargarita sp.]|nr:hypothetical protein [Thiomargarita sp.]
MTLKTQLVFEHTVAHHLEELLTIENKSINALIRDMIEERYEKLKKQKRLDNFYTGIGLSTGLIGETSIQKIKANKSV